MSNYYVYLQVWSTQLRLIVLYAQVPSILSTICIFPYYPNHQASVKCF